MLSIWAHQPFAIITISLFSLTITYLSSSIVAIANYICPYRVHTALRHAISAQVAYFYTSHFEQMEALLGEARVD